ncbi:hypothetical protein BVH03_10770 [Pseudomonas sp. PA15(2017)]|uniref:GspH/FimT family protein n=1 Tax=Pseudomonas sp. PA15(2017) TaxID=1932111 RepID=UPI000960C420|nr:GspH/FimT family pseudopilin [Pseudomonas sp. PA15(2017)]OLU29546.1 hypothetical protein BVH03_10770 [Pseudomonas sp. PA15(2017)]
MNRDHQKALSLVELLVAVVLLGIMISMIIPTFARFQEQKRHDSARDLLASYIQKTRASAVVEGRPYKLCGSSDGEICDGTWASYWLIATAGEQPTIVTQQAAPTENICRVGFGGDSIRFHPNGTSWTSNGTIFICNSNGPHHLLTLNRQGRLRFGTAHNSGCC